jgi:alanyl-tRNA synthetase
VFKGETAFKLHDTFGFPLDLTADVCRERGVSVDVAAFAAAMAHQKEQARAAGKFRMAAALEYDGPPTSFHGYDALEYRGKVLALYREGSPVAQLEEGELGVVVLDETPFYAESGGQVGDRGVLQGAHGIFAVEDTQKIQAAVFGHQGVVRTGGLKVGDERRRPRRRAGAVAHRAQPFGDPPDAQGAARSARQSTCSRRGRWSTPRRRVSTSRTMRR